MENLIAKAKGILEESMYATLATCSEDCIPWVSPVYTGHDDTYNLYFSSAEDSQHMKNTKRTIRFL